MICKLLHEKVLGISGLYGCWDLCKKTAIAFFAGLKYA